MCAYRSASLSEAPTNPMQDSIEWQKLRAVARVKRDVIAPRIANGRAPCGTVCNVDLSHVVPDYEYVMALGLLCLLPQPAPIYYPLAVRTAFCRRYGALLHRFQRARRFRQLYLSIMDNGLQCHESDVLTIPWIIAAGKTTLRVHAGHRSKLARFLGVGAMPVLVLAPRDIASLVDLPEKYREILDQLPEPDIDMRMAPAGIPSWLRGPSARGHRPAEQRDESAF